MTGKWDLTKNFYNAFVSKTYPVYLINFITEKCNARCPHCFVDTKKQLKELSLVEYEKITSTTGPCLRNVALTGGEPFLREDIFEIADIWYTNSSTQSLSITTNGSMPEQIEDFLNKASRKKIPVTFLFSYDFIEEKHSDYRNLKDLHLKVVESYNIVKKFPFNTSAVFQITVSQNNFDSAEETYEYLLNNIKTDNINCSLIRGSNADCLTVNEKNNISQVYKTIQERINKDYDRGILKGYENATLTNYLLNAKNKLLWKNVHKTFLTNEYISPCRAGFLLGVLYSNGDIMPCELLNQKIGNLKDFNYNFLQCWESDVAKDIKRHIIETKCRCTFECAWLINIFADIKFYPKILFEIAKDFI